MGVEMPVDISALSKQYRRGAQALRSVDLKIEPGEITALVGPNGAGKTTLLKILLGFEKPTAGRVSVYGLDPWRRRSESLAKIGYVPQANALYQRLTVAENLALAGFNRPSLDVDYAKARLDRVGIGAQIEARRLSGGQQAQLLLAIALATHARLLLLDEPLANLDPLARREFLQALRKEAAANGTTVILTSHIVTDIDEIASSVAVIGDGRLRIHEPIAAALARHLVAGSDQSVSGVTRVGSFAGRSGELRTLWCAASPDYVEATMRAEQGTESANLEDLVLGYLAVPSASKEGTIL